MIHKLKLFALTFSMLLSLGSLSAQSLDRKVFASQGGNTISAPYYFSFTIGEVVIGTDNNALPILTKGFEQPIDPTLLEVIHQQQLLEELDFQYKIYPNPVHNKLFFSYKSETDAPRQISLLNALGQTIFSQSYDKQTLSTGTEIDLEQFPIGSYWLLCSDLGKKSVFPLRKE